MSTNINQNKNFQEIRRNGRILAFQTLFAFDFNKQPIEELLTFNWLGIYIPNKKQNMRFF